MEYNYTVEDVHRRISEHAIKQHALYKRSERFEARSEERLDQQRTGIMHVSDMVENELAVKRMQISIDKLEFENTRLKHDYVTSLQRIREQKILLAEQDRIIKAHNHRRKAIKSSMQASDVLKRLNTSSCMK